MQHEGGRARPATPVAQPTTASALLLVAAKDLDQRCQALATLLTLDLKDEAEQRDPVDGIGRGNAMLAKLDSQAEQLKELVLRVEAHTVSLAVQLRESEGPLRGSAVSSVEDAAQRKQEAEAAYREQATRLKKIQRECEAWSKARFETAKRASDCKDTTDRSQASLDALRGKFDSDRDAADKLLGMLRGIRTELVDIRGRREALGADALAQWASGLSKRLGSPLCIGLLDKFNRIESERQSKLVALAARKVQEEELESARAALAQARLSESQAAKDQETARQRKDAAHAQSAVLVRAHADTNRNCQELLARGDYESMKVVLSSLEQLKVREAAAATEANQASAALDDAEARYQAATKARAALESQVMQLTSKVQAPRAAMLTPSAAAAAAASAGDAIMKSAVVGSTSTSSVSPNTSTSKSQSNDDGDGDDDDDDPLLTSFLPLSSPKKNRAVVAREPGSVNNREAVVPEAVAGKKRDARAPETVEEVDDDDDEPLSRKLSKETQLAATLAKPQGARVPTTKKEGIDENWDYYSLPDAERMTYEADVVGQAAKLSIRKSKIATETITYLVFALHKKPSPAYHILLPKANSRRNLPLRVALEEDGGLRWPPKDRLDSPLNVDEQEIRGYGELVFIELSDRTVEPDIERFRKDFRFVELAWRAKKEEEEEEEDEEGGGDEDDGDEEADEEDTADGDDTLQGPAEDDNDVDEEGTDEDDAGDKVEEPAANEDSGTDEDANQGKAPLASHSRPLNRMVSEASHASIKSDSSGGKKRALAPSATAAVPTPQKKVKTYSSTTTTTTSSSSSSSSSSSNNSGSGGGNDNGKNNNSSKSSNDAKTNNDRISVLPTNVDLTRSLQSAFKNVIRQELDAHLARAHVKKIAEKRAARRQKASVDLVKCVTDAIKRFNIANPDKKKQIKRGQEDERVLLLCQCLEYLLKEASGMGRVPEGNKDTAMAVYESKFNRLCSAMALDAEFEIVGEDTLISYKFSNIKDAMKRLVKTAGRGKGLDDERFFSGEKGNKADVSAKQLFEGLRTWNVASNKRFGV